MMSFMIPTSKDGIAIAQIQINKLDGSSIILPANEAVDLTKCRWFFQAHIAVKNEKPTMFFNDERLNLESIQLIFYRY